jgi:hypothetical protein
MTVSSLKSIALSSIEQEAKMPAASIRDAKNENFFITFYYYRFLKIE